MQNKICIHFECSSNIFFAVKGKRNTIIQIILEFSTLVSRNNNSKSVQVISLC